MLQAAVALQVKKDSLALYHGFGQQWTRTDYRHCVRRGQSHVSARVIVAFLDHQRSRSWLYRTGPSHILPRDNQAPVKEDKDIDDSRAFMLHLASDVLKHAGYMRLMVERWARVAILCFF